MSESVPPSPPKILLIGATGLVGQAVLAASPVPIVALARRWPQPGDAAARQCLWHCAPVADWPAQIAAIRPDVLLCALGTTIKQAGSDAAFRGVDHDLVLDAARAAKAAGTRHAIIVTAVGADADSGNFYLRTKGAVEAALSALRFDRLDLLHPGLLTGERRGPRRAGERVAMALAPVTDRLLHGPLRRYRSIAGDGVARAMLALALDRSLRGGGGVIHRYEHDAIIAQAQQIRR